MLNNNIISRHLEKSRKIILFSKPGWELGVGTWDLGLRIESPAQYPTCWRTCTALAVQKRTARRVGSGCGQACIQPTIEFESRSSSMPAWLGAGASPPLRDARTAWRPDPSPTLTWWQQRHARKLYAFTYPIGGGVFYFSDDGHVYPLIIRLF
jgi:hypothetical protein